MTRQDTDQLARTLAADAAPARQPPRLVAMLALGILLALAGSIAVVLLAVGPRPNLAQAASHWIVQFKVIAMALLACGGAVLVRAAVIPGVRTDAVGWLTPAALFLLGNLLLDRSHFPLMGAHALSVPICVGTILLASLPSLAALLGAMRAGIPTRPVLAGACAGLLAGSLGALAYTIACVNDGAAFVAVWYGLALLLSTGLGAVLGPRVLAW